MQKNLPYKTTFYLFSYLSKILFSYKQLAYTSGVCKRVAQDGPKIELQTPVHILTKFWWIFTDRFYQLR